MQILRSVPTLWAAFALAVVTAAAYVGLIEPFTSRYLDGLFTAIAFAAGGATGFAVTRLVPKALASRRQRARSSQEPATA